jgi:hypothetical protein
MPTTLFGEYCKTSTLTYAYSMWQLELFLSMLFLLCQESLTFTIPRNDTRQNGG